MPASTRSLLAVAACFRHKHLFKQRVEDHAPSHDTKDAHRNTDYL